MINEASRTEELEKILAEKTAQLDQRTEELAVINSVQEGLVNEMDIQSIYDLVGNKIRDVFDAQAVIIATFDPKAGTEEFNYTIEKGERFYLEPRPYDKLRSHIIKTKQKVVINKREEAFEWFGKSSLPGTEPLQSGVFMPLITGQQVRGYISLQNVDREDAFSTNDVRLLETLGNSMSVALENARHFDQTTRSLKETEQRNAELAVINSVQEALVAQRDIKAIYELVGEKIREIFIAQVIDITTYDPVHNLIEDQYSYEKGDRSLLGPREPKGFRKHVIDKRQMLVINEDMEKQRAIYDNTVLSGKPAKSLVMVPLIANGQVTGIIDLQNLDQENAFSDSDISLLSTLANSMSVALEGARLFDESARLLKETEQRKAELAVINSVQEGLAKELNISAIYELVGNRIREVFDAQVVGIATFDHSAGTEQLEYLIEKGERYYPGSLPINKLRQHLIQTGEKIVINSNFEKASARFGMKSLPGTEAPKSAMYVPLIVGKKVTSYVSLQNIDREYAFSDSDVRLLETLANSMSVALENARLFDETSRLLKETEQRTAELAVINSVQDGLARELDIQGIFHLVGDRVQQLFDAQVVMIASFDLTTQTEHFNYVFENGEKVELPSRPLSKLRQTLIAKRQTIYIETEEQARLEYGLSAIGDTEMPKSMLYVPLIAGNETRGYVSLQNLDTAYAFSDPDIRLLETLANSMSVALENARLFDETNRLLKETEQRTAELAVINSVQDGLSRELDIHGIYKLVGDRLCKLFPDTQSLLIRTFNHESKLEYFEYFIEKGIEIKVNPRPFMWANRLLIQSKQALLINENYVETANKYGESGVTKGQPPKSAVFVPMLVGETVKGSVSLQNVDRENAFTDSDLRLLTTLTNSMSVALENARLFDETNRLLKETEQRTAELAVINSVQEGLAKEIDMQGIYDLVGDRIRDLFDAQAVIIATFDHETGTEYFKYHIEKGVRSIPDPRPYDKLRQYLIQTRQRILINNSTDEIRSKFGLKVIPGTEMPKSLLFVPLTVGDKIPSYVSLQNVDKEDAFTDSDVRLLETLANSMSVALENARLFDETNRLLKLTEDRAAELAVINSVQAALAAEVNIQGIYDAVGDKIREIFDAQVVDIVTYDTVTALIHPRYVIERGKRFYEDPRPLVGFRKHVIETRQPLLINKDIPTVSAQYGNFTVQGEESKSLLFVPMIVGGEAKGVISLQNLDHENAFSESNVSLLTTLSNSMSVALESARLFDETTRLLKETEQRTAELAVINSVQDGLAKELDMQAIYDLVGDRIIKVFNAPNLVIRTFDHETGMENWRYAIEKGKRQYIDPKPFVWHSKQLIKNQKPIQINENYLETSKSLGGAGVFVGQPTKSGIFVPMIVGGIVKGSVSLQNVDKEFAYTEADLRLLTTITNSMSVALENARLFDETNRLLKETEQRTAELGVINSIQEGLVREMNMQAIYDLVGDRLYKLFNTTNLVIRTFDHETQTEYWRYSIEKGEREFSEPRPIIWANKQLIKTQKPILINENYLETAKRYGGTGVSIGHAPKSAVFVPMVVGDVVKGSVSLQNVDNENAYSEADLRLLTTLTNSLSVALENARLFDETNRLLKETEQRNAELAVINSVQESLVAKMDIQGIYELVGEKIRQIFDAQVIDIVTFDRNTNQIEDRYAYEKGDRTLLGTREPKGFRKHVIDTGQLLLHNENVAERMVEFGNEVLIGDITKSHVFIPMIAGGEVKGVISLQNLDREHAFSESDVNLLSTLANSMSVALESARLFDETTRLLTETEQRNAELAVINSVQESLVAEMNMQAIYELVGEKIREIFKAQVIDIVTYDKRNNLIEDRYSYEKGDRTLVVPREPKGFRKHVISSRQIMVINQDVEKLSAQYDNKVMVGEPAKSMLFVPMIAGGEVTGIISLQNLDKENAFSDSDVSLLTTLVNSMSVALKSASLFDETSVLLKETEQRNTELAVINSVQDGLVSEMNMQAIYDLVGNKIRDVFDAQVVAIATFDLKAGTELFKYIIEKGERFYPEPRPLDKLRQHLIDTRQKVVIKNHEEAFAWFGRKVIPGTKPLKSAVFVPLIINDKITSYVTLQNIDKENAFSDSDIRLLETLSNSMSVALENARLFDETNRLLKETEQRNTELAVINSVQEGLVKEMDMQGIYDLVGNKIRDVFDAQAVIIATFDQESGMENFQYAIEKGERFYLAPRAIDKLRQSLIDNRQKIVINENFEEAFRSYGMEVLPGSEFPKSALFVPLKLGDKITSYVSLQNVDRENAFSESDVRLMETLANSMSVALENARLFDETNRLLKETEQQKGELAVINSVQEGLVREMNIQAIYELVGDRLMKLFPDTQVLVIRTFDQEKGLEYLQYAMEKGQKFHAEPRGLVWANKQLIKTGQPLHIKENYAETAKKYGGSAVTKGEAPKSAVFVPMLVGDVVRGSVSLQNVDREHAFSDSDLRLLTTLTNSMSVALENARLFDETTRLLKETEQRTAELAIINSVQEGLASKLDIQAIYDLVGDKIRDVFDTQGICISYYDRLQNFITHPYYLFNGKRVMEPGFDLGKGLTSHIINTGQPLLINENAPKRFKELGAIFAQAENEDTVKSWLGVPLISGGQVNGTIRLENYERENAYSDSDVSLLQTLSNSMSVALENARLFDETNRLLKETEQRTAELAVINSVQEGLAKELDMEGIYSLVGERVQKLFKAQAVIIATFDTENKVEQFNYLFENGQKVRAEPRSIGSNKVRLLLIEKKQTIYIPSEEQHKEYGARAIAGTAMTKTSLFVPLLTGNIIKGYVSLQNIDHEHAFTQSDIRLLETLANSMSVALENARLFDETNRLLKETEQRTAELAVINSVQDGLAKELDMQGIYNLVGGRVQTLFKAQVVAIATFDLENKIEHFNYIYENGEIVKAEPRSINKLRRLLIEKKQSVYIRTEEQARKEYEITAVTGTSMPKSLLFVPLLTGSVIKGYVSLQNIDHEHAFTQSDIRLLETLSSSMSVAIENARLFDETSRLLKETEQRTAELAVINSVQEGLARELDIQGIYNLIGDRLCELFPDTEALVIRTFDYDTGIEQFRYAIEKGERLTIEPHKFIWASQHLIRDRKAILINENYLETSKKYGGTGVTKGEPPKSAVFVPMMVGDVVKGSISLQNVDRENAFSDSDLRLLTTLTNSMSVALENARLFDETTRLLKETEQRTAELAVINSVQEGLAKELDMQGIYDLVGDRLCDLFPDTQTLVIRTFDHDTGIEHWHYAKEKGEKHVVEPRPFNWNSKQLILTKKPLDIKENYVETAATYGSSGVTKGQPPKSAVFVPMIVGDLVKGSVSLQNVDKEHAFTDADLRLLTTITNSMSVALENARLFDETHRLLKETEQRTGELAVINSVQEGLAREMDMQAIYDMVGDRMCKLFNIQTVLIRTFDHQTNMEHWRYAIEKGERLYSEPRPFMWANKTIIQTKKPLLINENYIEVATQHGSSGASKGSWPKSAVFVPMMVGDMVRGSVSLQNIDQENAFSDADMRLLTTITNSMSVALENARLFDETTHLLAEAKQRAQELSTVNNISRALASQLDPDDLIKLVGDHIRELFKANIAYLALYDKTSKMISFPYQYGEVMDTRIIGEGLTSKIIMTKEPLLINKDVAGVTKELGIQRMGADAASYLGVPIPVGEDIVGVLSVQSTEQENWFNESDQRLLSTIAASVGVAMNNARLFEDVKLAKLEAEAASKTAEKANEAKSAFLSTVSHELRTPLTSVLGFTKIIRKRLDEKIFPMVEKKDAKTDKTISQISENLNVVISEGERLTHLINDVLDLAKIEAGKMEWSQENVSMAEVTERAIAATSSLFDQKKLKLDKHIAKDLPDITGDKDKLIQVIINLISNAVKFTDKGTVGCKVYREKDEMIVSITDTGIGIAPEDFGAVFEQFKQVGGDTLTDKPKGTGLGLPICKEIVEHHGGRIWLESTVGKGSTFSFALPAIGTSSAKPLHLDELVKQLKEQMAHSPLVVNGTHATILVVDDDESIRSLLAQELGDAGYIVEQAVNGKDALESVRRKKPDLIILDVMMPEMNGFDVAAILKNDPQTMDIPIIVLSVVMDKSRGFRIGVDRYLTKPIDTTQLFTDVGTLLEQGKSKKKVMIVDENNAAVKTLADVLQARGYQVMESDGKELVQRAIDAQPDIIILNSVLSSKQEIVQSLRFEKGLENVLFLIYQ